MDRTEEEKLFKSPIVVVLGGEEHEIPILVIKDAREWRKKFIQFMQKIRENMKINIQQENQASSTDNIEDFTANINLIVSVMPDEITDLFFAYAKNLNRDEIESIATEVELSKAIEQVMAVAFPLSGSLTGAMNKLV